MLSSGRSGWKKNKTNLLVEVVSAAAPLEPEKMVASLLRFPWYSSGANVPGKSQNAWEAVRIVMRMMFFGVTEAPCEGNGSLLGIIWSSQQNASAESAFARVHLKQAGLTGLGGGYEDVLVVAVLQVLGPRVDTRS